MQQGETFEQVFPYIHMEREGRGREKVNLTYIFQP